MASATSAAFAGAGDLGQQEDTRGAALRACGGRGPAMTSAVEPRGETEEEVSAGSDSYFEDSTE